MTNDKNGQLVSKYLVQITGADTFSAAELIQGLQLAHGLTRAEAGRVAAWLVDNGYVHTATLNLNVNGMPESVPNGNEQTLY